MPATSEPQTEETAGTGAEPKTATASAVPESEQDEDPEQSSTAESIRPDSGIYGDMGEKLYYPCDAAYAGNLICWVCDPEWYDKEYGAEDFYNEVFGLSDRYRKEHPFSAGSILKPYYPDIDEIYWFTGSFEGRYVVLEAYDTSNVKKYFLIEFTIADGDKLDTVSIREVTHDEACEYMV